MFSSYIQLDWILSKLQIFQNSLNTLEHSLLAIYVYMNNYVSLNVITPLL